jgi:type II secretory pathway pseudopilin PulG
MKTKILRQCSDEKGMALVIVLMVVMVFAILGSVFVARTVNEKNTAEREKLLSQAYYVAEAGADAGLAKLDALINTDLLTTVNTTNPNILGSKAELYATNQDGLGFLVMYVKQGNTPQLVLSGSQAQFSSSNITLGSGTYRYDIVLKQKSNPVFIATDIWDFPYYYQIQTTATVQNVSRKVRLDGDLTVRVQRDNFAKFALFTDHHSLPSTATVWFTSQTNFAGPLHTNERYSFAFNPSGTFEGAVTQQHNSARFYNNGFNFLADADANGAIDRPIFNAGYTRGVSQIVLASSVQQADLADQAKGGQNINSNGIYVPYSGANLVGGIFVKGSPNITLGVDGSNNAKYTVQLGGTTKVITVNRGANTTSVVTNGGAPVIYNGLPDGIENLGTIIYVDGTVNNLNGIVQRDTELTVSSQYDINISGNIKYQNYTPGVGTPGTVGYIPPNANGETNLLGLVAWGGDVNVTSSAPNNIEMHGIVMARNGIFQVDNYTNTGAGPRGEATLLGGVITQFYGAFGLYSAATGNLIAGYGRNFVYDSRTLLGKTPPYFPSMKTFIAFTNDLTDKVSYQEGGF